MLIIYNWYILYFYCRCSTIKVNILIKIAYWGYRILKVKEEINRITHLKQSNQI